MAKKVFLSSTPIKLNTDPVNNNRDSYSGAQMEYQRIYHGIYLTSIEKLCSPEDLKIYGFTHLIYIDKHIIENNSFNAYVNIRQMYLGNKLSNSNDGVNTHVPTMKTSDSRLESSELFSGTVNSIAMNISELSNNNNFTEDQSIYKEFSTVQPAPCSHVYSRSDFQILDLNFGETSYLTTVLPNCYKAVKFIESALKQNGAVLVIDCIGGSQKCITIVISFLMYKYNKNFS